LLTTDASASQRFENRYGYLVDATNKISDVYYQPGRPSEDDLARIARTACDALTRLAADANFRADLMRIAAARSPDQQQRQVEDLRKELQPFINRFLVLEKDQLLAEGFDRRMVDATIFQLELNRTRPPAQRATVVEAQIEQVGMLANAACKLADTLAKGVRNRAIAHTALSAIVMGLGGIALMAVDVAGEVPSAGVETPVAVVSVHMGVEMVLEGGREAASLVEQVSVR